MKLKTIFFKKSVLVIAAILLSVAVFSPISQGQIFNTTNLDNKDFSITIHRIRQDDDIDPWPHTNEAEWQLNMYVNGQKQSYECSGDDLIVDQLFVWEGIITEGMKFLEIKFELLDHDLGYWPDEDDIADISAYVDENYHDEDYDDTTDFQGNRPAYFKRYFNLFTNEWATEDENNDFLEVLLDSALYWYVTSGNNDGSNNIDENDATIWFDISVENTAPHVPEKPVGVEEGWINNYYTFSTKTFDDDGDRVMYAWDWDGDNEVDELTAFYESWETVYTSHSFSNAEIYYVKVKAVDEKGKSSEWSEPLKVEINGPYGKNGFEFEEWSLGHIYIVYMDHFKTQELLSTLRGGGNIVTAAATLITAIAAACGIPLDISISIAIITAILRLGVEILNLVDQGMGIYLKAYLIEIVGAKINGFCYIWKQSYSGNAWESPEGNSAPNKINKLSGETSTKIKKDYTYSATGTDPDGDEIAYIYEWSDGTYTCVDYNISGETVFADHNWSKKGSYAVRVKSIDVYGHESSWSESLVVQNGKNFPLKTLVFFNAFFKEIF